MHRSIALLLAATLALTTAHAASAPPDKPAPRRALPAPTALATLEWDDLLPDDELMQGFQDTIPEHDYLGEGGMAAQQQGSSRVRDGLDNRLVKIPGFIVPLAISPDGVVTEAFLVPYFGACIHVPPPPPNQIVYIRSEQGFRLKSIYDPFWITGTMRTQGKGSRLGLAAYTLQAQKLDPYTN